MYISYMEKKEYTFIYAFIYKLLKSGPILTFGAFNLKLGITSYIIASNG